MVKKIELRIRGTPSQVLDFIDDYFDSSSTEIHREVTKAKTPAFTVGPPKGEPTGRARLLESPGEHTYIVFTCEQEHWDTVQPFWSVIIDSLRRAGFIPRRFILQHAIIDALEVMQEEKTPVTGQTLSEQLEEMEVINPTTGESYTPQHINAVFNQLRKLVRK